MKQIERRRENAQVSTVPRKRDRREENMIKNVSMETEKIHISFKKR